MSFRNASHDWHIVHSSVTGSSFFFCTAIFRERLSGKKHATIPNVIVGFSSSLFFKDI